MTVPADSNRAIASRMAGAAGDLLDALDPARRQRALFPFPADRERQQWFYTPTDHGGLPLSEMTSPQHRLVHRLVASGLSTAGYVTVAAIMGLENVLDLTEGWTASFERDRGRDPLLYWIGVFGTPGSAAWGWRFGGHHVSIHFTILDGVVASTTPCFLGADPAAAPLLGPHLHRPLGAVEDLARELVHTFDRDQLRAAQVSPVAPSDLVGSNRPELSDGDRTLPLELIWRGRFEGELDRRLTEIHQQAEAALGIQEHHHEALAYTVRPKGLRAVHLSADQKDLLRAVLDTYLGRIADSLAAPERAKYAGDAIDDLYVLWAGSRQQGEPHYYRVHGNDLFVEYDNTQRDANHVHSVWRDLANDFGRDALAMHYGRDHRSSGR